MREYLVKLRSEHNLTQADMARGLDISEPYYQMIEAGKRQQRMDITLAAKLSTLLSVSLDFIESEESKLQQEAEPMA